VVDATGRGSGVDHYSRRSYADRLVALPLTVGCDPTGDGILRLAPTRSGWWYWMDSPATAQTLVFLTDGDLLPRSTGATLCFLEAERASEPSIPAGPLTFATASPAGPGTNPTYHDARTGIRRAWNQPRRFPIGDSAFSLDPLSGSGLVRAIRMASTISDVLCGEGGVPASAKVRSFTVSVIEEFQRGRGAGRQFYAQAASRFPDSVFWARRFPGGLAT
jgi:hypothetical protein